jgi:hypothetical protein
MLDAAGADEAQSSAASSEPLSTTMSLISADVSK